MMFWRRWHRWLGTGSALLLVLIGVTGILLQIDEVTGFTAPPKPVPVDRARLAPVDTVALAARAQTLLDQNHGGDAITWLRLESRESGPAAVVRFQKDGPLVEIDLKTGRESKADDGQPKPTLLRKIRLLVLNLHTFGLVGPGGHVLGIAVSGALAFLGGSGLWMWLVMRKERVKRSKHSWFWR